jgi:hypothetical protein
VVQFAQRCVLVLFLKNGNVPIDASMGFPNEFQGLVPSRQIQITLAGAPLTALLISRRLVAAMSNRRCQSRNKDYDDVV